MDIDRVPQLGGRDLVPHGKGNKIDDFLSVDMDQRGPQDEVRIGIHDHLDHSARVANDLGFRHGLDIGNILGCDLDAVAGFLRLRLR